jgi:hypothetical protein
MKQVPVTLPEVGLFAATRGMIAAGAALLLSDRIAEQKRKTIAVPLIAIGALSTIPFAIDFFHKAKGKTHLETWEGH